ncbi:uncharacterized protein [Anoplolepis gracilipes]|uniref:uncharacterized protein n=1 Tax=Anoplolepis gracilipes TaxID=354296 RepID=UPI003BA03774
MSLMISILFILLLSLISGSTESEKRIDPVVLLQTLQHWRKIYNTYKKEMTLGYCLVDYLFQISNELSTNLSAPPLADTTVEATKSQQNPFPQNAMADTMMPLRETQKEKHLREKRSYTTARSAFSKFTNDSDKQIISRPKIIQEKWMINKVLPIIPNKEKSKIDDGNKRLTSMIDFYIQKNTVNPTPNPKDDDKVDFESTDLEKDTRPEVLYSHRMNHHDSFVKDTFVLQNLNLFPSRGRSLSNYRFPSRQYSQLREKNSKVNELLSDLWTLEKDRGIKRDLAGDRIPLNNYGSSLWSHLQFQRINMATVRCTGIVKLTNSVANSSCNPVRAINSEMSRRKPEELSRDSLLLPYGERVGATERSPLESPRESGKEAVKRNAFSRFGDIVGGSDTKKGYYQQPRVEKRSRIKRSVSKGMIHPHFLSRLKGSPRSNLYENRVRFPIPTVPEGSKQDDGRIRAVKGAASLSRVQRFIENYATSTSGSIKDSRLTASQARQLSLSSVIIPVFRTLGIFVQVHRQIMDVIETNKVLECIMTYLWAKFINWIESDQ